MNRCPTAAIPLALAGLLVATVSNAADTTPHYDDARVTGVSVISQNPADQAGPMAFYEKSQLKAVCQYGYVQTGSGAGIPWTKVHLYILSSAGVPFVFSTQKACLSQTCTAEGGVPTDVGTGAIGIGTGAVGIGCKITRQDGVELKDADPQERSLHYRQAQALEPRFGPILTCRVQAGSGGRSRTCWQRKAMPHLSFRRG